MLRLTIRSKRVLDIGLISLSKTLSTGINISMCTRTKQEAVRAIAENIEEIGSQLREYSSSKITITNF
jgi:hypothetical protein